VDLIEQLIAV